MSATVLDTAALLGRSLAFTEDALGLDVLDPVEVAVAERRRAVLDAFFVALDEEIAVAWEPWEW